MSDVLSDLQVITYMHYKDVIVMIKPTSTVLMEHGDFVKNEFDKFLSTYIPQYLVDVIDKASESKKGDIQKAIQDARCNFFVWDNQELAHYSEDNLYDITECDFNILQNAEIVIQINGVKLDRTKMREEKDDHLTLPKQGFTCDGIQTLQIPVNPDKEDLDDMLLSPYSGISGATTNPTTSEKCHRALNILDWHLIRRSSSRLRISA